MPSLGCGVWGVGLRATHAPLVRRCSRQGAHAPSTLSPRRYRLPLGISVNMAAFSATLMAEVSYQPKILLPYLHLGLENEMTIQDVRPCTAGHVCRADSMTGLGPAFLQACAMPTTPHTLAQVMCAERGLQGVSCHLTGVMCSRRLWYAVTEQPAGPCCELVTGETWRRPLHA